MSVDRLPRPMLATLPTPAYVYDLAEVRVNQERLRRALPTGARLYYSLKANPHPAILAELRAGGAAPEVCSPGELDSALDCGWAATDVLYGGPAERDQDVARAIDLGVREFSVDSPVGLDQLDRLAGARDVHCHAL